MQNGNSYCSIYTRIRSLYEITTTIKYSFNFQRRGKFKHQVEKKNYLQKLADETVGIKQQIVLRFRVTHCSKRKLVGKDC